MSEPRQLLNDNKPWLEYELVLEGQELARDLKHKAATLLCNEQVQEDLQAEELVNKLHKDILSSASGLESLEGWMRVRNAPIVSDGAPVEATPALAYTSLQQSRDEHQTYDTHMELLLSMNQKINDFQSVLGPPHIAFANFRAAHKPYESQIKELKRKLELATDAQQLETRQHLEHVSRLEDEWAAQRSEMQKRHGGELSAQERKISTLQIRLVKAQHIQNGFQSQQKNLESELADTETDRDGYHTKYQDTSDELSSLKLQHLDELKRKQMELEVEQKNTEEARNEHVKLWNYWSKAKREHAEKVSGLEANLALQKTSLKATEEKLAQKSRSIQELGRDLRDKDNCIDRFHELVSQTEKKGEAALQDQDRSHQGALKKIINEKKQLSTRLEEVIKSTEAKLKAAQLEQNELPGLKSRVESLQAQLKGVEGERNCLKLKAENLLKLANTVEKKLKDARQANIQLASECQASVAAVTNLKHQVAQFAAAFGGTRSVGSSDTSVGPQDTPVAATYPQSQSIAIQGAKRGRSEMDGPCGGSDTESPRAPGAKRVTLPAALNRPKTPPAQEPETPKPLGRHTLVKPHYRSLPERKG